MIPSTEFLGDDDQALLDVQYRMYEKDGIVSLLLGHAQARYMAAFRAIRVLAARGESGFFLLIPGS